MEDDKGDARSSIESSDRPEAERRGHNNMALAVKRVFIIGTCGQDDIVNEMLCEKDLGPWQLASNYIFLNFGLLSNTRKQTGRQLLEGASAFIDRTRMELRMEVLCWEVGMSNVSSFITRHAQLGFVPRIFSRRFCLLRS